MGKAVCRVQICVLAALVLAAAFAPPAHAQVLNQRFGTASPGRVEAPPVTLVPSLIPNLQVEAAHPITAPAGAEKVTFTLQSVRFEGATVYTQSELRELYAGMVGQTVSLRDIYGLAERLTRKYRDDGYILTRAVVPPQTIEHGVARLRVVEGFINKIDVRSDSKEAADALPLIRSYLDNIERGKALQEKQLERALLLANDLPGIHARGVLSASKTTTGASDLLVVVDGHQKTGGEVSADDFGTRYMGPLQFNGTAYMNSQLLKNNERITLQGSLAPSNVLFQQMGYLAIDYLQPIGSNGMTLQLNASDTNTHPGYNLTPFDVKGQSKGLTSTLTYPVIRSRTVNLNMHATLDYHHIIITDNIPGDLIREDHITALRIGGRFQTLDMLFGPSYDIFDVEASKGLDAFGASQTGTASLSRPTGNPLFRKITAEAQRLQHITDGINLLAAVKGQATRNPLLSSEQFGVGGTGYGRGYDPSEIIGDTGVSGKLELQWNQPYPVNWMQAYQLYGFWDIGETHNANITGVPTGSMLSLASVGGGTRMNINQAASANFFVGVPLTKNVQTRGNRTPKFYFSLSQKF